MQHKRTPKRSHRSFTATMVAIAWSFVGLRRKRDFDQDVAGGMHPAYVIAAALTGAAIFVGTLIACASVAVS